MVKVARGEQLTVRANGHSPVQQLSAIGQKEAEVKRQEAGGEKLEWACYPSQLLSVRA